MPATPFFNTDCFGRLRHAAYDATTGRVVATDSTSRMVWVIGADGYSASVIDGGFNFPDGVAVDSQGRIVVADRLNHRIKVFGPDLEEVLEFGTKGISHGRFNEPAGVAISPLDDSIVVADYGNHRVQVFNRDGGFVEAFGDEGGGDGEFRGPAAVAVDAQGRVYVAEDGGRRVQVFDGAGTVVRRIGGLRMPQGVAVDADGVVYITEDDGNRRSYRALRPDSEYTHHPLEHHPVGLFVRDGRVHVCTGPRITVQALPQRTKLA